jgi:hypothetical protein
LDKKRRTFIILSVAAAAALFNSRAAPALEANRPAHFLADERRIIEQYYSRGAKGKAKGLPPGLAKRGNLPPGLQKH